MIPTENKEQSSAGRVDSNTDAKIIRICKRGHEVTAANAYFRNDGFPECKKCRNLASRKSAKSPKRTLTEQKARLILETLHNGGCIRLITNGVKGNISRNKQRYVQPPICSNYELRNFRKAHPKFDAIVTELAAKNAAVARSGRYGNRPPRKLPALTLRSKRGQTAAIDIVNRATQRICPTIRDEVRSEMNLAISEGKLNVRDVPSRVPEFIALINRRERHSVTNRFGNLSLDAPITTDSTTPLIETITRGLWE